MQHVWFGLGLSAMLCMHIACSGNDAGELGAPCSSDADCKDDLICDMHGRAGSCQTPHSHD